MELQEESTKNLLHDYYLELDFINLGRSNGWESANDLELFYKLRSELFTKGLKNDAAIIKMYRENEDKKESHTMTFQELEQGFKHYFNTKNIFLDEWIYMATGEFSIDVFKLERWLTDFHGFNPNQEEQSMSDFIVNKFGQDASDFVRRNL